MYRAEHVEGSNIDSVTCVGGSIEWKPWVSPEPNGTLTMVYVHHATGTTFGSCPLHTAVMSPRTRGLLRQLLESAEQDFGETVFERGLTTEFGTEQQSDQGRAESGIGLRRSPR